MTFNTPQTTRGWHNPRQALGRRWGRRNKLRRAVGMGWRGGGGTGNSAVACVFHVLCEEDTVQGWWDPQAFTAQVAGAHGAGEGAARNVPAVSRCRLTSG